MPRPLLLASGSATRFAILQKAGIQVEQRPARIDEETIRTALEAESATPRDIADALAEMKARKISERDPAALVLGCDQVLDFEGHVLAKPETAEMALAQLRRLRGHPHHLISAIVLYDGGKPIWRHLARAKLSMKDVSDQWLAGYVDRNWPAIGDSVGAYRIEEEGIRLFSAIEGDYFTILGLPLLPLLSYLETRGFIAT